MGPATATPLDLVSVVASMVASMVVSAPELVDVGAQDSASAAVSSSPPQRIMVAYTHTLQPSTAVGSVSVPIVAVTASTSVVVQSPTTRSGTQPATYDENPRRGRHPRAWDPQHPRQES